MKAWILERTCDLLTESKPLRMVEMPEPVPGRGEVLLRVVCCGVCHTEIDEIEGRTPPPTFPVIPGHQVVGIVVKTGPGDSRFVPGDRIGVAWIFSACGTCEYCVAGMENLCSKFLATGRDRHGGYAQYMVAPEQFTYAIPGAFSSCEAAPLLCAGAIGFRSLRMAGIVDGQTLGLTGFGASGHLVLKMARYLFPATRIQVFARNPEERDFARELGAVWAGDPAEQPPEPMHAIIDTTPVWQTVTAALLFLRPGGRLVINAIRKESRDQQALLKMNYHDHLWMEKEIKSVANITRADVTDFLALAAQIPIKPETESYPFENANDALADLRHKRVRGGKVLIVSPEVWAGQILL